MTPSPECFSNVSVVCRGNVYFDGGVISHTVRFPDGTRKTLGFIRPGMYRFDTGAPERMEIVDGVCRAKLPGAADWKTYPAGTYFDVPGNSAFDIAVDSGLAQYICSFG
jgi:hypothetical protein